jgi:hypothetical protein
MEPLAHTSPAPADSITVTKSPDGWEVSETHDATLVRTHHYSDWHRVERAVQVFESSRLTDHSTNR